VGLAVAEGFASGLADGSGFTEASGLAVAVGLAADFSAFVEGLAEGLGVGVGRGLCCHQWSFTGFAVGDAITFGDAALFAFGDGEGFVSDLIGAVGLAVASGFALGFGVAS
jgi:hypothetical protein